MLQLVGTYECKLDSKNRLAMPSGLLKQLPEDNAGRFVLNRGFETNLILYSHDQWQHICAKVDSLNRFNPKVRRFVRNFYDNAHRVQLDSTRRMLLPKPLLDFSGIKQELIIACLGYEIEIWNPKQYHQQKEMSTEEYSDLTQELLGSEPPNELFH